VRLQVCVLDLHQETVGGFAPAVSGEKGNVILT
jgi:hypothetical protein